VYASGFETGSAFHERAGYDAVGRDGLRLSAHWADGMRTLHGIHSRGFPNMFIVQPSQGANLISNVPHNLVEAGQTIAAVIGHAIAGGFTQVEVTGEEEDRWVRLLKSAPQRLTVIGSPDCTPGYYNNEGDGPNAHTSLMLGYPQGPVAYFRYLDQWRASGSFTGLEFR
ncbi:MAG: monooxygenase, partial [Trebonia sp.]